MKVVIQRVTSSSVEVDKKIVGKIDNGLNLLVSFTKNDNLKKIEKLAKKIVNLRIFDDQNHIMNKSLIDINGKALSISQFTLYADTKKGNRPSYVNALNREEAIILYNFFNKELEKYVEVEKGIFGSNMKVLIENDGPVTIIMEE